MAKNQIEIDKELLERIRPLAFKNGITPNHTNLVQLALEVAVKAFENLDEESFEQVTNFKK